MTEKQYSQDLFQQYTYNLSSICHINFNINETGSVLLILDTFDATNTDQVNKLKKVKLKVCAEFRICGKK